jgi:hypothetical protein
MQQAFEEIERHYEKVDPWGYQTNPEDARRADYIFGILDMFFGPGEQAEKALDIGAGEGWITQYLPARSIFGYELSDKAASRFHPIITRVKKPEGQYDLVVTTGTLYHHYDWVTFLHLIKCHSSNIVLTCNIKDWEVPEVKTIGKQIFEAEFPYREWTQKLRIFKVK